MVMRGWAFENPVPSEGTKKQGKKMIKKFGPDAQLTSDTCVAMPRLLRLRRFSKAPAVTLAAWKSDANVVLKSK